MPTHYINSPSNIKHMYERIMQFIGIPQNRLTVTPLAKSISNGNKSFREMSVTNFAQPETNQVLTKNMVIQYYNRKIML